MYICNWDLPCLVFCINLFGTQLCPLGLLVSLMLYRMRKHHKSSVLRQCWLKCGLPYTVSRFVRNCLTTFQLLVLNTRNILHYLLSSQWDLNLDPLEDFVPRQSFYLAVNKQEPIIYMK